MTDFVLETIITYHRQYMTVRWLFRRTLLVVLARARLRAGPRRAVSAVCRPVATAG